MSLAASKTALMVEVEVQLKAGKAICKIGCKMRVQIFKIVQIFKKNCLDLGHCTWLSRQYSISFMRLSPVTTPAGTISIKPILRWKSIKRKNIPWNWIFPTLIKSYSVTLVKTRTLVCTKSRQTSFQASTTYLVKGCQCQMT